MRIDELTNATEQDRAATLVEISSVGNLYRATLADTNIVLAKSVSPEGAAAKALADIGITGEMVTCWLGGTIIAARMPVPPKEEVLKESP